jgi:Transglutaminase-like superfamily
MAGAMMSAQEAIWRKWRRFRTLPPLQRERVFRAMAFLPLTEAGLRMMGFRRWKQLIEHFSPPVPRRRILEPAAQLELAESITRAAGSAERHGPGTPNCLERSLTLWWLLRREGIDGELRIGARKNESRFEAHAWVELRGVVLNDSPNVHKHYARFDAPIAADLEGSR